MAETFEPYRTISAAKLSRVAAQAARTEVSGAGAGLVSLPGAAGLTRVGATTVGRVLVVAVVPAGAPGAPVKARDLVVGLRFAGDPSPAFTVDHRRLILPVDSPDRMVTAPLAYTDDMPDESFRLALGEFHRVQRAGDRVVTYFRLFGVTPARKVCESETP